MEPSSGTASHHSEKKITWIQKTCFKIPDLWLSWPRIKKAVFRRMITCSLAETHPTMFRKYLCLELHCNYVKIEGAVSLTCLVHPCHTTRCHIPEHIIRVLKLFSRSRQCAHCITWPSIVSMWETEITLKLEDSTPSYAGMYTCHRDPRPDTNTRKNSTKQGHILFSNYEG